MPMDVIIQSGNQELQKNTYFRIDVFFLNLVICMSFILFDFQVFVFSLIKRQNLSVNALVFKRSCLDSHQDEAGKAN